MHSWGFIFIYVKLNPYISIRIITLRGAKNSCNLYNITFTMEETPPLLSCGPTIAAYFGVTCLPLPPTMGRHMTVGQVVHNASCVTGKARETQKLLTFPTLHW